MKREKTNFTQWALIYIIPPIAIIAIAAGIAYFALSFKKEAEKTEPKPVLPTVEVIEARAAPITLEVTSQGTVQARTETSLVAEVSGRIESISPALFAGGFFEKGDILIEIDPIDYVANLAAARGRLAEAQLAYEQELASSEQAQEDWEELGKGNAPGLALREPQLKRAKANLNSAEASLAIAERDLERTTVKAPYAGRVREKLVDIGQMVNARATIVARIYSVDMAEIRLPISIEESQFIDLPESYSNRSNNGPKPRAIIEAEYASRNFTWEGVIDRTEGTIDPLTRLSYVVAQVQAPYAERAGNRHPPLKVGMFVKARIEGKTLKSAITIPRKALRGDNQVFVIDENSRLSIRSTSVYKTDTESAIITDGLSNGDRICVTPLEYAIDGMLVIVEADAPPAVAIK